MKLGNDPGAATWLEEHAGAKGFLEWDAGNRTKNHKHKVAIGEVEAIFARPFSFEGRILEPAHTEPRWLLLGQTNAGRRLALIFTRRGDRLRPISCRPMRPKEKQRYDEALAANPDG